MATAKKKKKKNKSQTQTATSNANLTDVNTIDASAAPTTLFSECLKVSAVDVMETTINLFCFVSSFDFKLIFTSVKMAAVSLQ